MHLEYIKYDSYRENIYCHGKSFQVQVIADAFKYMQSFKLFGAQETILVTL
jgi:hypothetical protein